MNTPSDESPRAGSKDIRGRRMRRLGATLALVATYMAAEVIGGILSNSLALLADAGHMLADAGALGLALFAQWIARRPASPSRSFGYHRAEVLAALANGTLLVTIAVLVIVEALGRLLDPPDVRGGLMIAVASGGLAVNLAGLWLLREGRAESINVRGAWLHVLADTLGSLQTILAGALILTFGWRFADPVASMLIALLVIWSSWSLLRDAVSVLMECAPAHVDARAVLDAMSRLPGVETVHDLHIWSITSGFDSLSAHVRVAAGHEQGLLGEIRGLLQDRFGITHSTIQIEGPDFEDCRQDVGGGSAAVKR
ncbi:MAG: cation transporter [Vicinamibacteria bacterium]|nr:cation transporter [Vicinamibacteria bacterium]